jgi:hypothetical protein
VPVEKRDQYQSSPLLQLSFAPLHGDVCARRLTEWLNQVSSQQGARYRSLSATPRQSAVGWRNGTGMSFGILHGVFSGRKFGPSTRANPPLKNTLPALGHG